MHVFRRISLPAHGLVELTVGLAMVIASLALGMGIAGTVAVFTAGVILAGLGLGAADNVPLATHLAMDRLITTLLAVGSTGLALTGEVAGALLLLGVAAFLLVLTASTRWVRAPIAR